MKELDGNSKTRLTEYKPAQTLVNRGLTLIEVLAAISIMLVLIAIVAPVLVIAKEKAKESSDLNELHQLGLAGAMYHDQFGEFPTGVAPLVASGLAPTSICSGLVDQYSERLANVVVSRAGRHYGAGIKLETPYRNSYIGPREFGMTMVQLRKYLGDAQATGWLVDLSSWRPSLNPGLPPIRYRRVLDDSAVVSRIMVPTVTSVNGHTKSTIYTYSYFGDPSK